MMLESWNLFRVLVAMMVNTVVLVLLRYLEYFAMQTDFLFEMNEKTKFWLSVLPPA